MEILKRVSRVKKLIAEHGKYQAVAEATGINYHWICKFATGSIPNPGVNNVGALEKYFSKQLEQREQPND